MKNFSCFDEYDFTPEHYTNVTGHAINFGCDFYGNGMDLVLSVAFSDPKNLPNIVGFNGEGTILLESYIKAWVNKYKNGFNNRPSMRTGNPSSTHPDPLIKILLHSRLPNLSHGSLDNIVNGHQLLMSIENIVGDILEEYLAVNLKSDGWECCWGSTVESIDFIHKDGRLLQVKNSSNSENSSSSKVRYGTKIIKWFRRVATKQNTFHWKRIQEITERTDINEDNFREFAIFLIENNPNCIYIADDNPLI